MSVRAKLRCSQAVVGAIGVDVRMDAVYEGSDELQRITENAIFGEATPAAWVTLSGRIPSQLFVVNDEFYLDLDSPDPDIVMTSDNSVLCGAARLRWQSAPDTNFPGRASFRIELRGRDISGEFYMAIHNPSATEWLSSTTGDLRLTIRNARGRKSDAEIAVRQRMLASEEEIFGHRWDNNVGDRYQPRRRISADPDAPEVSREEYVSHYTRPLREQLERALGNR